MKTLHFSLDRKQKYAISFAIFAFLLFYFLFPIVEIGLWCNSKKPKSDLPEASEGMLMKTNMFTYTMFLINGKQLEYNNEICIPDTSNISRK